MNDADMERAVKETIYGEGWFKLPVTVVRNDDRMPSICFKVRSDLVFYEVRAGGSTTDTSGQEVTKIVVGGPSWRAIVDRKTGRVYRLFGFSSNDFADLMESLDLHVDSSVAESLSVAFAELVYSEHVGVVQNIDELRKFIDDELSSLVGVDLLRKAENEWFAKETKRLEAAIKMTRSIARLDGFDSRLVVAVATAGVGIEPTIELHVLMIHVERNGRVELKRDKRVVTFGGKTLEGEDEDEPRQSWLGAAAEAVAMGS